MDTLNRQTPDSDWMSNANAISIDPRSLLSNQSAARWAGRGIYRGGSQSESEREQAEVSGLVLNYNIQNALEPRG
jgi:hypothetical protein